MNSEHVFISEDGITADVEVSFLSCPVELSIGIVLWDSFNSMEAEM